MTYLSKAQPSTARSRCALHLRNLLATLTADGVSWDFVSLEIASKTKVAFITSVTDIQHTLTKYISW
jgi:S-adenosylmethionine:tRNA-ribosyltransferase-isomerase (queuine synthetase)